MNRYNYFVLFFLTTSAITYPMQSIVKIIKNPAALISITHQARLMSLSKPQLTKQTKRFLSKSVSGADWYYGYSMPNANDAEIIRLKMLIAECNTALAHCHDNLPGTVAGVLEVNKNYAEITKNLNTYKSQLTTAIALDDAAAHTN